MGLYPWEASEKDSGSSYIFSKYLHLLDWQLAPKQGGSEDLVGFSENFLRMTFVLWNLFKMETGSPFHRATGWQYNQLVPFNLPMGPVKSIFNLTILGNAKPPASEDGPSKWAELQNADDSPLLGDKRIISTQALVLSWSEKQLSSSVTVH